MIYPQRYTSSINNTMLLSSSSSSSSLSSSSSNNNNNKLKLKLPTPTKKIATITKLIMIILDSTAKKNKLFCIFKYPRTTYNNNGFDDNASAAELS